jgi:hypothetical protein
MYGEVDYQAIFADTPVILAYLFGSQVEGRVRADSDVDVAVLLDEGLSPAEQGRWQLELIGRLTDVWHTDQIDLIVLNRAPAFLQHQVIKARRRIYVRDEAERVRFEVQVMRNWFDWQPYYSELNRLWLRRVRERAGKYA